MERVTEEKLISYVQVTARALQRARVNVVDQRGEEVIDMVERYVEDAHHFWQENDYINAFAALNYAHGWLDCGARLDVFDVTDDTLFTVDSSQSIANHA